MQKNNWIWILLVLIFVGGFMFLSKQKGKNLTGAMPAPIAGSNQIPEMVVTTDQGLMTVEGGVFYFKPNEIRVKKGNLVKIAFTNIQGTHDFVLDEFNVRTKIIGAGKSETVEFTPNKTGEFEFYCSVGNHKAQGMVGKIIVED